MLSSLLEYTFHISFWRTSLKIYSRKRFFTIYWGMIMITFGYVFCDYSTMTWTMPRYVCFTNGNHLRFSPCIKSHHLAFFFVGDAFKKRTLSKWIFLIDQQVQPRRTTFILSLRSNSTKKLPLTILQPPKNLVKMNCNQFITNMVQKQKQSCCP